MLNLTLTETPLEDTLGDFRKWKTCYMQLIILGFVPRHSISRVEKPVDFFLFQSLISILTIQI